MTAWEAEAQKLGYQSEEEMWRDLYLKQSMSQLARQFGKGINTIRARIDYFQIEKRKRGGPNNTKVDIDAELIEDIINLGVLKAAAKRGIKPQTLYQRLYYQKGLTVKDLKAKARLAAAEAKSEELSPNVPDDDTNPQR